MSVRYLVPYRRFRAWYRTSMKRERLGVGVTLGAGVLLALGVVYVAWHGNDADRDGLEGFAPAADHAVPPTVRRIEVAVPTSQSLESAPSPTATAENLAFEGRVLDDDTEAPIEGAVVETHQGKPPLKAATDADGRFRLEGVPNQGQKRTVFMSPWTIGAEGYVTLRAVRSVPTSAPTGGIVFRLRRGVRVFGRVIDHEENPVAFASLRIWNQEGASFDACFESPTAAAGRTDAAGRFEIGPIVASRNAAVEVVATSRLTQVFEDLDLSRPNVELTLRLSRPVKLRILAARTGNVVLSPEQWTCLIDSGNGFQRAHHIGDEPLYPVRAVDDGFEVVVPGARSLEVAAATRANLPDLPLMIGRLTVPNPADGERYIVRLVESPRLEKTTIDADLAVFEDPQQALMMSRRNDAELDAIDLTLQARVAVTFVDEEGVQVTNGRVVVSEDGSWHGASIRGTEPFVVNLPPRRHVVDIAVEGYRGTALVRSPFPATHSTAVVRLRR